MKFYSKGQTTTTKTDDSWAALRTSADHVGLNGGQVVTIAQSYDLEPAAVIPKLGAILAAQMASPKATLPDIMASQLSTTSHPLSGDDTTKAKKNVKAKAQGEGSPGLVTDIAGDIFESFYPWLMILLGAIFALVAVVVLLAGIAKSPLSNVAVGLASKGAV